MCIFYLLLGFMLIWLGVPIIVSMGTFVNFYCFCVLLFFSRTEWPKEQFIPPYVPRFRNGWEPPMLNFMGAPMDQDLYQLAESVASVAEHQRKQEIKRLSTEVKLLTSLIFAARAIICGSSCISVCSHSDLKIVLKSVMECYLLLQPYCSSLACFYASCSDSQPAPFPTA